MRVVAATLGGDWEDPEQLLMGEGESGPGDWPPPAWASSSFFRPWVGADIHASWLQGHLLSVTSGAEELSDRQLVVRPWQAGLCWTVLA